MVEQIPDFNGENCFETQELCKVEGSCLDSEDIKKIYCTPQGLIMKYMENNKNFKELPDPKNVR